jgi:hypothetical protein
MEDIVNKLRCYAVDPSSRVRGYARVMTLAADEIVKLREYAEELRKANEEFGIRQEWWTELTYQFEARLEFAKAALDTAVAHEREACAAFLELGVDLSGLAGDQRMHAFTGKLLMGCAAAIRARGEQ